MPVHIEGDPADMVWDSMDQHLGWKKSGASDYENEELPDSNIIPPTSEQPAVQNHHHHPHSHSHHTTAVPLPGHQHVTCPRRGRDLGWGADLQ